MRVKLPSRSRKRKLKRQGEVRVQKNMLILFERFHRCGVNAFYGMSKFYKESMLDTPDMNILFLQSIKECVQLILILLFFSTCIDGCLECDGAVCPCKHKFVVSDLL